MNYTIKYSEEAIAEMNKAVTWYKSKELGLDQRFRDAFNRIRIELKENPEIFKEMETNHRRAILGSSFPYTIHYSINDKNKTVKVIGIFHQGQNLELVKEKIKLRKTHGIKNERADRLNQRTQQLKMLRKVQKLDRGKSKDRDMEL